MCIYMYIYLYFAHISLHFLYLFSLLLYDPLHPDSPLLLCPPYTHTHTLTHTHTHRHTHTHTAFVLHISEPDASFLFAHHPLPSLPLPLTSTLLVFPLCARVYIQIYFYLHPESAFSKFSVCVHMCATCMWWRSERKFRKWVLCLPLC